VLAALREHLAHAVVNEHDVIRLGDQVVDLVELGQVLDSAVATRLLPEAIALLPGHGLMPDDAHDVLSDALHLGCHCLIGHPILLSLRVTLS